MAPDVAAKFKNSLRSKRWNKIDLGGTANYTNENMVNRWNVEKNKWLEVSVPISTSVCHGDLRVLSHNGALWVLAIFE